MICKCPNCDGALEYNPSHSKMECPYCGNTFEPQAVMQAPSRVQMQAEEPQIINKVSDDTQETMECKIYACTSCGGELVVNDVESSTFCAYCGQPTVVFSRVSRELRPKYILPFQISKEQAVQIIREKFSKGMMVPDEIKNFQVERLRGIYIPYFLYNIYCYDFQILEGTDKNGSKRRYLREAQCEYKGIPLEASYHLNDEMSKLLGYFDFRNLKPFEPAYLSGFYADRYDIDKKKADETAVKRVMNDFNRKIRYSVPAKDLHILEQHPKQEIRDQDYVLMPVWFMTFRYQNEPYTMLVNGQNGVMAGAVPFKKSYVGLVFVTLTITFTVLFMMIGGGICAAIMSSMELGDIIKTIFESGLSFVFFNILIYTFAGILWKGYRKKVKLTKEKQMVRFVKDRQEDT